MSGVKPTREGPAIPLPAYAESTGIPDGDNVDWPTGPGTPQPLALDDLTDVDAPAPDDGDVVTWVDADSAWKAMPGGAAIIPAHTYELANEGGDPLLASLGNLGATETIDPTNGNVQSGTIDANCTITLGAPSGNAASLLLWLTNDGTAGRTVAFAGSVSEIGTRDDSASVTNLAVATTINGGTSWVVAWVGGGGPGTLALDDLTDVTITAPAEDETLRYDGSEWFNDNRRWEAVTDGEDVFVWVGDDLVHEWETY